MVFDKFKNIRTPLKTCIIFNLENLQIQLYSPFFYQNCKCMFIPKVFRSVTNREESLILLKCKGETHHGNEWINLACAFCGFCSNFGNMQYMFQLVLDKQYVIIHLSYSFNCTYFAIFYCTGRLQKGGGLNQQF